MDLELHHLELRYAHLRKRHPAKERHLLGSLSEIGQQLPIVVFSGCGHFFHGRLPQLSRVVTSLWPTA